ncbi:hypothetical protein [Shinella zoogloeoides]|uniref:hypothetical protein n=1 Tax=Shinella zoogloeoides TaxID=352475 RepID=UPI0028B0ABB9|nr:hypothetical protein [Shinella zoogloeoides]
MPKQNVVTEVLTARADAFMDMEDDLNVAFRQSRLAMITLEHALGEVRALHGTAKRLGDACMEYHLRQIARSLSAVFDAVMEADAAAGRLEHRYYLGEAA